MIILNYIIGISAIIFCLGLGYLTGWLKGYNTGYNKYRDRERKTLVNKMNKWSKEKYKKWYQK